MKNKSQDKNAKSSSGVPSKEVLEEQAKAFKEKEKDVQEKKKEPKETEEAKKVKVETKKSVKPQEKTQEDKKSFLFTVAKNQSITSLKGILSNGQEVKPNYLIDGQKTLDILVEKGYVIKNSG